MEMSSRKGMRSLLCRSRFMWLIGLFPAVVCMAVPASPDLQIQKEDADFSINSSSLPLTPALRSFAADIASMVRNGEVRSISVVGSASPDGPSSLNERLALERAHAVADFLVSETSVDPSLISVRSDGENIKGFVELVMESDNRMADGILDVLASPGTEAEQEAALRALNNGATWTWLASDIFPRLRTAVITLMCDDGRQLSMEISDKDNGIKTQHPAPFIEEVVSPRPYLEDISEPMSVDTVSGISADTDEDFVRHLYLKSNLPAWLMLWTNVGVELDVSRHWSVTLPVYYSGFNYFRHTLKWRTLTLQPEGRYWFRRSGTGPFIGAHFSVAWYNVAFEGRYRYQDHDRRTPALGGGVSLGWRFNISSNPRWQMEASIGGGVYRLDYDLFQNRYNGLLVGRRQRTFFGIDQAALSISYRFDLEGKSSKKKGGEK